MFGVMKRYLMLKKIEIMKANFNKLTPEQKINFNVLNDVRVIKNADYSNWENGQILTGQVFQI